MKNLSLIVNNSVAHSSISLKFGTYVVPMIHDLPYMFKVMGSKIKVAAWRNGAKLCQIVNNSAGGCSISIKLTTDYDHVTSDLPQTFKVNGSKVKVIALYGILALKIVTFHELIAWLSVNFVQTIPAQHVIHVQGHKVKYSNCNNSAADYPISLKFRTEFDRGEARLYTCSRWKVKGQGQGVKVKVTA